MTTWSEDDSAVYRALAPVAVPRRQEMIASLVGAAPFADGDLLKIVELGSEERRVGKECPSKCRSRWSPYH